MRGIVHTSTPWLVALLMLAMWDLSVTLGFVDSLAVSRPGVVAERVWEWSRTGYILPHITATLFEVFTGYVGGTVAGLAVAFLFFFYPPVASLCEPFVSLLNAIPRSILAPLTLVLFGVGALSKVVLVVLVVFLIALLNLYAGLREVDRSIIDNARVMGATRSDLIRHVYLPASLMWIVTAMRISIGHAFTTAIVCELLGATAGLGWLIEVGQATIKPDWMMAGLFVAAVVTLVFDFLILAPMERKGAHWRVF